MDNQLSPRFIVDFNQLPMDIRNLVSILKKHINTIKHSELIDLGNDIEYSAKNITKFINQTKQMVFEEAKKYETDIFGNRFSRFTNYRYLEFIFSQDYKSISSLRLYGQKRKRKYRYTLFNLKNPYDYNIVNLISNIKQIIEENTDKNFNNDYLEFVKNYFTPVPPIHTKKKNDLKFLNNISKKYDTGKPKTYEQVLEETQQFNLLQFKSFIYDIRKISFNNSNTIEMLLGSGAIQEIIDKIDQFSSEEPLKAIEAIYLEILDKFNIADLISFAQNINLQEINIFPLDILNNLPVLELFDKIDNLPNAINKQIYSDIKKISIPTPNGDIDFSSILTSIENLINDNLTQQNANNCDKIKITKFKKNIKIKEIFSNIKIKYSSLYDEVESKFNELFPRQILNNIILNYVDLKSFSLKIPDIKLPTIELPTLEINDLFSDFSEQFDGLVLKIISISLSEITKSVLELLLKTGSLEDFVFENILKNPGELKPNIPKYENIFNQDWNKYLQYAYKMLVDSQLQKVQQDELAGEMGQVRGLNNLNKIKSKNKPIGMDICLPMANNPSSTRASKRNLTLTKNKNLSELLNSSDIDGIIEKTKYFSYSEQYDFFLTDNVAEEKIVDTLNNISFALKDQTAQERVQIPNDFLQIGASLSNMIEQIESVLNPKELSMLLNGKYSNQTAEIIRTICKINFPILCDNVDPIKYFTMLGKVVGNTNKAIT
jgi:hypothetical protein